MNSIKFFMLQCILNSKFLCGTRFFKLKVHILNLMGCNIHSSVKIVGPIFFNRINNLKIDKGCWIGKNFEILGNGYLTIEENCDIGPYVTFFTGSHKIESQKRRAGEGITYNYTVGKGSWLGGKVNVGNGAKISSGVVIGMDSLVIKNCAENSVYVGKPAYKVKDIK